MLNRQEYASTAIGNKSITAVQERKVITRRIFSMGQTAGNRLSTGDEIISEADSEAENEKS